MYIASLKMAGVSTYTEEIADRICERIATSSDGLHAICSEDGMPSPSTVFKWLTEQSTFSDRYARAREAQAELLADEIIEIADETSRDTKVDQDGNTFANSEWINRSRLRVDARKWKASKLAPKKYGDKVDVTSGGEKIKVTPIIVKDQNASDQLNAIGD